MLIDFDYGDLLTISCALHTLDVVYGSTDCRNRVMQLVDSELNNMNNLPIDQLYPGACYKIENDCL